MSTVAVIGATGRLGVECVKQLLAAGHSVRALVRNTDKAYDVLSAIPRAQRLCLEIFKCDLTQVDSVKPHLHGCTSVIFTACGISFLGLFNRSGGPKYVDYGGVRTVVEAIKALKAEQLQESAETVPKLVLISSLGVTRPYWPIYIMLNTFGGRVMHYKLMGEDYAREHCANNDIDYTIIRPGRLVLAEKNPQLEGSDLVADQGDKVTGQILRADVAAVAIHCALNRQAATKATFELVSTVSITEPEHRENVAKAEGRGRDWSKLVEHLKSDFQIVSPTLPKF